MKTSHLIMISLLCLRPCQAATTVSWGSSALSNIVDSSGVLLDGASYTFELGVFINPSDPSALDPFTPDETNMEQWAENWAVFDLAAYEVITEMFGTFGQFSGEAGILGDGRSNYEFADPSLSFVGRQAYIWVYNTDAPSSGTEWFLAKAPAWIFPEGSGDLSPGTPVDWRLPDLGTESPVWGSQLGNIGAGGYEVTSNSFELQTFTATVVPEPSSAMLLGMGVCGLAFRRKRDS